MKHMFSILKGLHDIRIVYNRTSSGLNDALWALHFSLQTVNIMLHGLEEGSYQADMDVKETH